MENTKRITSFDAFRLISIFTVICIHTSPFNFTAERLKSPGFFALNFLIDKLCRFAVPYFFIVSGYFFGKALEKGLPGKKLFFQYAKRLLTLFLGWSFVYGVFTPKTLEYIFKYGLISGVAGSIYEETILFFMRHPVLIFFQGTRIHLWFLVSLVIALGIITFLKAIKKDKLILPIAAGFYLFGLLAGVYRNSGLGIQVPFDIRNGPFFSTLFVALGVHLSSKKNCTPRAALWVFSAGCVLQLIESAVLFTFFKVEKFDYSIFTILFGLGAFMIASAYPSLGSSSLIQSLAKYSLGIYVVHYLLIDILSGVRFFIHPLLYDSSISFVIFSLSVVIVTLVKKVKRLEKYVI